MSSPMLLSLFVLLSLNSVFGETCGGILEGETGHFSFGNATNQEQAEISRCLWIIQLHYETNIRFTLNGLGEDAHLNLYSEDQLTSCTLSDYTKLNSTQVGSSFEFLGKTLIAILPNSSASVAFSWHFAGNEDKNGSVATMKNSDYIISPNGLLEWKQLEAQERVTWGINPNSNFHMRWHVDVATSCEAIDNCACFNFAIFQLTPEGLLSEAVRTCDQSSEGQLKGIDGRAVVLIKVINKVEANKVSVSWGLDDVTVTEHPITQPPVPTTSRLLAATYPGLVSLDLETLESTYLTSEASRAVAVNNYLGKVYWSQGEDNASILRSNLDGSAKEIIVAPTGSYIEMLAIDEASGNVYFAPASSHEITVCNALGKNCTAVISNSSLVKYPIGIALDSENGLMYWGMRLSLGLIGPSYLIRANLDGSNAKIISTEFTELRGITLDKPLNVIYWADVGNRTIGTIDVSGGNKLTLVELPSTSGLCGIQVNNEKIYFGTTGNRTVLSVDKYSGRNLTTVFNSTANVYHLALYNVPISLS